jgi:UDP-N-acetylglucosamine diphosphorylase / glucose-1-phosphate thymidylyltransferase / UDP-N-acetylgalactosamine diphosphorylase / glucosamine-1-phosphate N-acetyltransferase / galactosamine-1-phosphate N-acetyltransferase
LQTLITFHLNYMSDNTVSLEHYFERFPVLFPELQKDPPWNIPSRLEATLRDKVKGLSSDFRVQGDVAIHKTARVEDYVTLKAPVIISAGSFIGAHAYLRGGVFLGEDSVIGPGCEVKSSMIMSKSALAHFNFIGDSLIGSMVNFEAGSIIANHFNERSDKTIFALINGTKTPLGVTKFGAIVGDHSKIGANAVLSPGTLLIPQSIVHRLELVQQC